MRKILVVYKRSAFELYSESPDPTVRAFLEKGGAEVERMERSHHIQKDAHARVLAALARTDFEVTAVSRGEFRSAEGADLVVTVGGDGTFLRASHGVRDQPVVGVNTDPDASVGFFCTATAVNIASVLDHLEGLPRTTLHRLEVSIDGTSVGALALNDVLYAHSNPAAVTRYRVAVNGTDRYRRSSGFLVATAAGSTGWMYQEGGRVMPIADPRIQYVSRSVRGERPRFAKRIVLTSLTLEAQLFLDGIATVERIALGSTVTVQGGTPLTVVGDLETRRRALE
ncbi:MAG: NAD(+)/NADH kinase [Planctomycetes bacterium]|nr:NAD(+)/NADH kinase [Planctomycetota bacterium]